MKLLWFWLLFLKYLNQNWIGAATWLLKIPLATKSQSLTARLFSTLCNAFGSAVPGTANDIHICWDIVIKCCNTCKCLQILRCHLHYSTVGI